MKKVTIKDIAAIIRTSPHTVSKALNNKPGVSEELRKKIKATARELNYVPNAFGRGLSGKPLKTIGVIVADNANPACSLIIKGLEKKAAESQYTIILCNSNEDFEVEKNLLRVLLEKNIDGVIISPVVHAENYHNIELLQQRGIPYILMSRTIQGQEHPCVKVDNEAGAYLAGEYLIRKGHTNIIYLTRRHSIIAVEERLEGLKRAFREHRLSFPEENIYRQCDVSIESSYTAMSEILRKRKNFTAVFAFNDIIAFGSMKAIYEYGLKIPEDVAVMGFDNLIFSETCLVPLTTVNQNLVALGSVAMEALLQRVHGNYDEPYTALPEPYIVERLSV